MKKKVKTFLLILAVFIVNSKLNAQDSIWVKVFTGDCDFSYTNFYKLDSISEYIPVKLIFQEKDKRPAKLFIDNKLRLQKDYDIVFSDKIYNSTGYGIISSELVAFKEGQQIFGFPMRNFSYELLQYSMKELKKEILLELPDSLVSTNYASFSTGEDFLFYNNRLNNKIVLFDKNDFKPIHTIDIGSITHSEFLSVHPRGDTISHNINEFYDILEKHNMEQPALLPFTSYQGNDERFLSVVHIPFPTMVHETETLTIELVKIFVLFDDSGIIDFLYTEALPEDYYTNYSAWIHNEHAYVAMRKVRAQGDNNKIIGKFYIDPPKLIYKETLPFELDDVYLDSGLGYQVSNPVFSYPYAMLPLTSRIDNLESGSSMYLPVKRGVIKIAEGLPEADYNVSDVFVDTENNQILVLITLGDEKQNPAVFRFDKQNKNYISYKIVRRPDSGIGSLSPRRFIDNSTFIYIDSEHNLVKVYF